MYCASSCAARCADAMGGPCNIGVAAARLLTSAWSGRHVQAVHGLDHLTDELTTPKISETTGRQLGAQRITKQDMRAALRSSGMRHALVEAVMGMSTVLEGPRTIATSADPWTA